MVRVQATAKVFELIGPVYLGFASRSRLLVEGYLPAEQGLAVQHLLDVAQACGSERRSSDSEAASRALASVNAWPGQRGHRLAGVRFPCDYRTLP